MKIFNDLVFRAQHALPGRSKAAAVPHWHRYFVEMWFTGEHDQDELTAWIESHFHDLHGANLVYKMKDSSDEGLAKYIMRRVKKHHADCVCVLVRNEGRRGAMEGEQSLAEADPYYGVGGRAAWEKR